MIALQTLFDNFLLEKKYVDNCSPRTISYFQQSYKTYLRVFPEPQIPTRADLLKLVVTLRNGGMTAGCCNSYFKGLNSFLDWLFKNGYLKERLRLKLLKKEKKVLRSFNDAELKKLISFRPRYMQERRIHAIVCLLLDTGIRIDEALTLTRSKIDFDSLMITVSGKGSKERVVPISLELRRILAKPLLTHNHELVF